MSTLTISAAPPTTSASDRGTVGRWLRDVAALTRRNLIHVRREPAQLSDATVQPILFTLLFIYVFGSAVSIAAGSYKDFAIGGLITMNLTTAATGTAVGLSSDLTTGVINRFRTLPMFRSAVLVGRTLSDLLAGLLSATIVVTTGLVIGWRPGHGLPGVLGAVAVGVLFSWALSWVMACVGLLVREPEAAQGIGFLILLPAAFVSSSLVPTDGMPELLRTIAEWNPVSAVAGACRELLGDPNPVAASGAWPAQHPLAMTFVSVAVIIALAVPAATALLRRRTTD